MNSKSELLTTEKNISVGNSAAFVIFSKTSRCVRQSHRKYGHVSEKSCSLSDTEVETLITFLKIILLSLA